MQYIKDKAKVRDAIHKTQGKNKKCIILYKT